MSNEIIPYMEMCLREGTSLQRGMNFELRDNHSVILMSVRPGAPYEDQISKDGSTLIYEGHDVPRTFQHQQPKDYDQPRVSGNGRLTQNGMFHKAAQDHKAGKRPPERVRVYEKIKGGIWSYNGVFHLVDSWRETAHGRKVFKFKLIAVEGEEDFQIPVPKKSTHRRIIPTSVKLEVWKRDGGKCVKCSSTVNLHFDHIIPFSKGGASNTADNIQLLCGTHNLQKHDNIE